MKNKSLLFLLLNTSILFSQNLFFLSIGNSHYRIDDSQEANLDPIKDADYSSQVVAEALSHYGGGIQINSTSETVISKCEILKWLEKLSDIVIQSNQLCPTMVIYFCGHGYRDNSGNVYLIPGENSNLSTIKEQISVLELMALCSKYVIEKRKKLNESMTFGEELLITQKLRYFFFIDCCLGIQDVENKNDIFSNSSLTNCLGDYYKDLLPSSNSYNYDDTIKQIVAESTSVVILGGRQGNLTELTEPYKHSYGRRVGPVARRIQKYFYSLNNDSFKMNDFANTIYSKEFDDETQVCKMETPKLDFFDRLGGITAEDFRVAIFGDDCDKYSSIYQMENVETHIIPHGVVYN